MGGWGPQKLDGPLLASRAEGSGPGAPGSQGAGGHTRMRLQACKRVHEPGSPRATGPTCVLLQSLTVLPTLGVGHMVQRPSPTALHC